MQQQRRRKIKERLQKKKNLKKQVTKAKVVTTYKGTESDHLNLQEGENIEILSEV